MAMVFFLTVFLVMLRPIAAFDKVKVMAFEEGLCAPCIGFFSLPPKGVWATYNKLKDIMDLELVEWGNAEGEGGLNTTCQHGPVECQVMRVYACNKYTNGVMFQNAFAACVDESLIEQFPSGLPPGTVNSTVADATFASCAAKQKLNYSGLKACAESSAGYLLFAKEKAKTPAHQGVPFVTIDGTLIYNSATLDLASEVCKAYQGPKPTACTSTEESQSPYSYNSPLIMSADDRTHCCACSKGTDSGSDLFLFSALGFSDCQTCCRDETNAGSSLYHSGKIESADVCSHHGSRKASCLSESS